MQNDDDTLNSFEKEMLQGNRNGPAICYILSDYIFVVFYV